MWNGTIGLIADPHLHDTRAGAAYGLSDARALRSHADTLRSTRVFNESAPAFRRALELCVAQGLRLVVIAGDLTDDGQAPNWAAVRALLEEFEARHGLRSFICFGNHDLWPDDSRPQLQRFVDPEGRAVAVSSERVAAMRRLSPAAAWAAAAPFGLAPRGTDLWWETPFGRGPDLAQRRGPGGLPDASYLVEPCAGLWLLSLDAGVHLPRPGMWQDLSAEGWRATLRHKPYLLPWMTDVAARARRQGKRLLAFSHYPVVDFLQPGPAGGTGERLMPSAGESARIAATGIGLHVSGHWHMNAVAAVPGLVNLALPSTAGHPAAVKLLRYADTEARLTTLPLGPVPGFDTGFDRYRAETAAPELAACTSHAALLRCHLEGLLTHRYLPRDWPEGFGAFLAATDFAGLLARAGGAGRLSAAAGLPATQAFADLYLLERAGDLAGLPAARRAAYRAAATGLGPAPADPIGRAAWACLHRLAGRASGLPDATVTLDLEALRIVPAAEHVPARVGPSAAAPIAARPG